MRIWPRKRYAGKGEGFYWRAGTTARNREIGVEIGCTGSPYCVAALHIRRTDGGTSWEEIHLTDEEIEWAITMLRDAQAYHREIR